MQDATQKYISKILSLDIPIKIPCDIVTYLFKENLEINFRGNQEIVDRYFNPLEEICRKQDFSFGPLLTNNHTKPNVMKKREYFKFLDKRIMLVENTVDIYFLGEKNTILCFLEGQENQTLLNHFQEYYSQKPTKMITDLITGGVVFYRDIGSPDKKRFVLAREQIGQVLDHALEKFKI